MIEVKVGGVAKWQVDKYTFTDPQMGMRSIQMTVRHPSMWVDGVAPEVPSFKDAYVEYGGEEYFISTDTPTSEKNTSTVDYIHTLKFVGAEEELTRRKVRDLATIGLDTFVSQGTSFSVYADIHLFANIISQNLKHYFGDKWKVTVVTGAVSDFVHVVINDMYVWELLLKTYEYYGVRWKIVGTEIIIGYTPDTIEHVFDYRSGLTKITRTAQDKNIFNRIIGTGGTRNIPINYFTNRHKDFPADPNAINDTVSIKNLMPKSFRDSVISGIKPYKDYVEDTDSILKNGVREGVLPPNDDIYPSIAGVEVAGLGRIDEVVAVSEVLTDTPDTKGHLPTFDIWVKDIGFNLSDNIYTTISDAKISFTSGDLAGYEFVILAKNGVRVVEEDTSMTINGVPSKYKITLIKSQEDFQATGRVLPNTILKPAPGDTFVIYDILMPHQYVELAELRLEKWLESQLLLKSKEKHTYTIETIGPFFEISIEKESDGKTIKEKIKSGNKIKIQNNNLTNGEEELHISCVTIQYGENIIPKYSIVISDKTTVSGTYISRVEHELDNLYYYSKNKSSALSDELNKLSNDLKNQKIGSVNLIRNAGFLGDYQNIELSSDELLKETSELYNKSLAYWSSVGDNIIVENNKSKSGKAVELHGSISQKIQSIQGETYTFSVVGDGDIIIGFGGKEQSISLSGEETVKIISSLSGESDFYIKGDGAVVFNPQLERGTVKTDFDFNPMDENPAFERLKAYDYLISAMTEGDTSVLGGLVLATMIQLGNYKDGQLHKVNAGVSGIYNNDKDPAFWGGGSFEQAIATVTKFTQNPNYQPTEEEWAELAKFVATHGGDVFIRGYIYALGGIFRGRVESNKEGDRIIIDPETRSLKGIGKDGKVRFTLKYEEFEKSSFSVLSLKAYNLDGDEIMDASLNPRGLRVEHYSDEKWSIGEYYSDKVTLQQYEAGDPANASLFISAESNVLKGITDLFIYNLPTSIADATPGAIYCDAASNNILKIKPR